MPDTIDPERSRAETPFDRAEGFSGQDYRREDEAALDRSRDAARGERHPDLPPDNGRRTGIDPKTGEVHGAGVGAGGGQAGEDLDQDAANGDGYPLTGGEGGDGARGDLGPPHFKE